MEGMKHCSGCMNELAEGQFCPHCGYNNSAIPENPIFIKPGTVINGFEFGKVLGHGGFGITYIGFDSKNNRKVAIKEFLPAELATRRSDSSNVSVFTGEKEQSFKTGIEKFKKEAEMLTNFRDFPGIVEGFELFEANNTAYFVMEYVEGITLKEFVAQKGGRIPFPTVRTILMPVIDALAEMHRKDILHRDISPDNIYITADKRVKLLDFGAARQTVQDQNKGLSVILKHGFTPKEQYFTKGNQGPWTDVYALGATAYYMMTGTVPQPALDRIELDKLVPLTSFSSEINSQADAIIRKALAVEEINRYQSVNDFKNALLNPETQAPLPQSTQPKINNSVPTQGGQTIMPENPQQPQGQQPQPVYQQPQMQQPNYQQPVYQQQPPMAPPKKKKGGVIALVVILGFLVLSMVCVGATYLLMPTIPDLTGETEEDALDMLKKAGFSKSDYDIEYEYDDKVDKGEVMDQTPEGGKKTFKKSVELIISDGPEEFELEDAVGKSIDDITKEFEDAGLKVTAEEIFSNEPEGNILSMEPAAGSTVKGDDEVTLTVSKGPDPNGVTFTDPNFKEAVIESMGLQIDPEKDTITKDMVKDVTDLYISFAKIKSLDGIEAFESLEYLYVSDNLLEDLPAMPQSLIYIDVSYNQLSTIDLSSYANLTGLAADQNKLTSFPKLPSGVNTIYVSNNGIKDISDVANYALLESLDVSYNEISDFTVLNDIYESFYYLLTDGNPVEFSYADPVTEDGWAYDIYPTYYDNEVISAMYDLDHGDYTNLLTTTLDSFAGDDTIIFYGPYEMGEATYDLYYFEDETVTLDFYMDQTTGACNFYDVYGPNFPYFGGVDLVCEVDTYQEVIDLLGDPTDVYPYTDIVFLDYSTPEGIYSFAFEIDGTLSFMRVFGYEFYYGTY